MVGENDHYKPLADSVYRVTEVIGVSTESWEAAARTAVETAAKTVRDLRVAEVSRLMVDAGLVVLVSFISPFRAERDLARRLVDPGEFVEFLTAPKATPNVVTRSEGLCYFNVNEYTIATLNVLARFLGYGGAGWQGASFAT